VSPRQAKGPALRRELLPGQSVELLRELHLVGRDGALHADSLRKLKQVNHLVQLLQPALLDVAGRHPKAQLLDAGAGNAYLGFVLYELFLRQPPLESAELISVESRPELHQRALERAQRLGFTRMRFVNAHLQTAEAQLPERLNLVLALHACDTATDDALALAVKKGADHVAVVPCCQAEVAAQLKEAPKDAATPWPLLWSHPIHRREIGAHLTNVIRALALQSCGYQVTVTELTGWEHSLKNELILGRRVHKEHRPSREELRELLAATRVRPQLVRELLPDLLPKVIESAEQPT
jgi:Methyltransferase domain